MDRPREEVLQSVAERPMAEAKYSPPQTYAQNAQYSPPQNQVQNVQHLSAQTHLPNIAPPVIHPPVQVPVRTLEQAPVQTSTVTSLAPAVPRPQISHEATQPEMVQEKPREPVPENEQAQSEEMPELTSTQEAPGALAAQSQSESQSTVQTVITGRRTSDEQVSLKQIQS